MRGGGLAMSAREVAMVAAPTALVRDAPRGAARGHTRRARAAARRGGNARGRASRSPRACAHPLQRVDPAAAPHR